MRRLSQVRRQGTHVADFVSPRDSRELGADDQTDGFAEPRHTRSGRCPRHFEIPGRPPGPCAGRGASDRVRSGTANGRLHLCRRQGHGRSLSVVPFHCARSERAPHEGRVGIAGRDAPRLVSVGRQPADGTGRRIPSHSGAANRARRRWPAARQSAPDGQGDRTPDQSAAARDVGVGGVVRRDATAEARRALGDRRDAARQRPDLRTADDYARILRPPTASTPKRSTQSPGPAKR